MKRYNRYTRTFGQPNFHHYRVITARFSSNCKCGANILSGDLCSWARGGQALCMGCYRNWEGQVSDEKEMCDRYNSMMEGGF